MISLMEFPGIFQLFLNTSTTTPTLTSHNYLIWLVDPSELIATRCFQSTTRLHMIKVKSSTTRILLSAKQFHIMHHLCFQKAQCSNDQLI